MLGGKGRPMALCQAQVQSSLGRLPWMLHRAMRVKLLFTFIFLLFFSATFFIRGSVITLRTQHVSTSGSDTLSSVVDVDNGTVAWDPEAVHVFAATDVYYETVEKPIIARVLDSVISSRGVQVGGRRRKAKKERTPDKYRRNEHLERWEMELTRERYLPYWSRFLQLLRTWSKARRFDPQVMEELVDSPLVNASQRHRTCAVVGNSGNLLRRHYGKFIDSHDMVIRINGAKTQTYEKNVGSKTSLAFVNSHMLRVYARHRGPCRFPYGGRVPTVVYICQAVHLMDVAVCRAGHPGTMLVVTDPRLDMMCFRIAKWYSVKKFVQAGGIIEEWEGKHGGILFHYSSGMQAVVLALGLCEQVSILGFGKDGARHHYDSLQKGEHSLHDYTAEYSFYDDLENNRSESVPFLNEASGFRVPPVRFFH